MGIVNTEQLASKYGVSFGTIYNWRKRGMPVIKQGGTVRYDESDVDGWLRLGNKSAQTGGDSERSGQ